MKGSDHLDFILDHRLYELKSTEKVEELIETIAPDAPDFHFVTRTQVLEGSAPAEQLILTMDSHNKVAKTLEVPELSGEVERAVWQVSRQLREQQQQQEQEPGKTAKDTRDAGVPLDGVKKDK